MTSASLPTNPRPNAPACSDSLRKYVFHCGQGPFAYERSVLASSTDEAFAKATLPGSKTTLRLVDVLAVAVSS